MTSLINASSPLRWDATMLGAATEYARANQACIMSPFILAGAMSPVTVAGLAAQSLAERSGSREPSCDGTADDGRDVSRDAGLDVSRLAGRLVY